MFCMTSSRCASYGVITLRPSLALPDGRPGAGPDRQMRRRRVISRPAPHRLTAGRTAVPVRPRSPIAASSKGVLQPTSEPDRSISGPALQPACGPRRRPLHRHCTPRRRRTVRKRPHVTPPGRSRAGQQDAPDRRIRGVVAGRDQLALGSTDGAASDGVVVSEDAAGTDGAATVGVVEPAGVLHARTAPPSETVSARATRIRLTMIPGFPPSDVERG